MNTVISPPGTQPLEPADYVDFKWLMAGEGYRVDAQRMQTDAEYACRCADLALQSGSLLLRALAGRLVARVGR